jgi:hypothetical protein
VAFFPARAGGKGENAEKRLHQSSNYDDYPKASGLSAQPPG